MAKTWLMPPVLSLVIFFGADSILQSAKADSFSPGILKSVVSLLPQWPGSGYRPKEPEGTAVAVFPGGYLATNDHIIGPAKIIRIRMEDGRILPAEIIGRDPMTDLALVKAPIDLPVPTIGPEPKLGERVCAVGNQFGLGLSVTCGVVSATRRTGTGFNPIEDFIQTDAVINPGGSGGALVDGDGRLVGLVSAIFTKDSDANIGVNFASSMRLVKRVARDLKDRGRVVRQKSGLIVRNLTLDEQREGAGAYVQAVQPNSPAAGTGIQVGDIITMIGDWTVHKTNDLATAVFFIGPGGKARIEYKRDKTHKRSEISFSN